MLQICSSLYSFQIIFDPDNMLLQAGLALLTSFKKYNCNGKTWASPFPLPPFSSYYSNKRCNAQFKNKREITSQQNINPIYKTNIYCLQQNQKTLVTLTTTYEKEVTKGGKVRQEDA